MFKRFILGFTNLSDLWDSVIKSFTNLPAIAAGIMGLAGFIFSEPTAIILLFIIMVLDWFTGALKAYRLPNHTFTTYKFQRMILNIVVAFSLIALAYHLGSVVWIFSLIHLDSFLVGAFTTTYFLSIFENLHEMDMLPPKVYKWVEFLLNLDNWAKRFFSKNNIPNEEPTDENQNPDS